MTSAILLSGGLGKRLHAVEPKQYLPLHGKPIILHSLEALLSFSFWKEIVIVCEDQYQILFSPYADKAHLLFAKPGKERQDSVFSGLQTLSSETNLVCIHDGARPLLKPQDLFSVLKAGEKTGAAALAIPVKTTIKEAGKDLIVKRTLDRSTLWEIQTPQVVSYTLLKTGMKEAFANHLTLTDDVSFVESLGHPVQLVQGSDSNLKITTLEDLELANILLRDVHG